MRWLVLLTLFAAQLAAAQPAATIAQAHDAYRARKFDDAARLYAEAVTAGTRNAALFYDLGNALFRAGDMGGAILNYERALALQPEHPEALANLNVAREKARALELQPAWWDAIAARGTSKQWTMAAVVAFWIFAFAFASWLLRGRRAPLLLFGTLVAVATLSISLAALYALETGRRGAALAIVTQKNVQARVATADNASSVLALPPGSQIRIMSERGDWLYAALPNDLRGWIPAASAERVRL